MIKTFIKTLKENTSINNHTENANLIVHNFIKGGKFYRIEITK